MYKEQNLQAHASTLVFPYIYKPQNSCIMMITIRIQDWPNKPILFFIISPQGCSEVLVSMAVEVLGSLHCDPSTETKPAPPSSPSRPLCSTTPQAASYWSWSSPPSWWRWQHQKIPYLLKNPNPHHHHCHICKTIGFSSSFPFCRKLESVLVQKERMKEREREREREREERGRMKVCLLCYVMMNEMVEEKCKEG